MTKMYGCVYYSITHSGIIGAAKFDNDLKYKKWIINIEPIFKNKFLQDSK